MSKKRINNYYEKLEEKIIASSKRKNKMKVSGASVKKIANIIRRKSSQ